MSVSVAQFRSTEMRRSASGTGTVQSAASTPSASKTVATACSQGRRRAANIAS